MTTPKHTPGPWSVDSVDMDAITSDYDGELVCEIAERETVDAKTGQWITCDATIAANAHLIAAAPAMYEALTDAERMWNIARMIDSKHHAGNPISNDLWSDFHQYLMEWHTKRKDALAQAERGRP